VWLLPFDLKHLDNDRDQGGIYAHLLAGFRASAGQGVEERWSWLMAAHIVGQGNFVFMCTATC